SVSPAAGPARQGAAAPPARRPRPVSTAAEDDEVRTLLRGA
ncbi:MAG: hypothetical protein JWM59_2275, partial [Verrucomicrobiales bacterium]|nr:hypothetical protein [Verrucomicrobiales bacterium]